ncbi:DUF2207 domain-containing protein [Guggenheimella bovis]
MKKWIIALLLLLCIPLGAFAETFEIDQYDIELNVDQSNNITVKETIHANFSVPSHGIIRNIPLRYYGYVHDLKIKRITDDLGRPIPFETSRSNDLDIRIGEASTYVKGPVSYVIEYEFALGDDRNREFDQVYFNMIGQGWNTTIHRATFVAKFPGNVDPKLAKVTRGEYGSKQPVPMSIDGNTISGETGMLRPNEGLTLRVDFEEGFFKNPTKPYKLQEFLTIFGTMIVGIFSSTILNIKNIRNNTIATVVSFDPPFDLNPPELGYIFHEERINQQQVASLVLFWAKKGLLTIEEEEGSWGKKTMTFHRLKDSSFIYDNDEKYLFDAMFSYGNDGESVSITQLKDKFYLDIQNYMVGLPKKFSGNKEILENSYQYLPKFLSLILFGVGVYFISNQLHKMLGMDQFGAVIAMGILLGTSFVILGLVQRLIKSPRIATVIILIVMSVAFIGLFAMQVKNFEISALFDSWFLLVFVVFLLVQILHVEFMRLKKYTSYARSVLGKVRGFEQFIRLAKAEELNALYEENPNYFYDVLPYAYVLGLSKKWGKHLEELAVPEPEWYIGESFNPTHFPSSFEHQMREAQSVPQSSGGGDFGGGGFGGGGFSGGGAGGGGGSSW